MFSGPELARGLSDSMIDNVRTAHVERVEESVAEPAIILLGSGAMPVCILCSLELKPQDADCLDFIQSAVGSDGWRHPDDIRRLASVHPVRSFISLKRRCQ